MAAVVELAGVSIVRNGSTLISDISWEIDEADRWVVIGPNGAGTDPSFERSGRGARRGSWHRRRL